MVFDAVFMITLVDGGGVTLLVDVGTVIDPVILGEASFVEFCRPLVLIAKIDVMLLVDGPFLGLRVVLVVDC